jgi:site-specific recombinase XerD
MTSKLYDELATRFENFLERNNYHPASRKTYRDNIDKIRQTLERNEIREYSPEVCAMIVDRILAEKDYSALTRHKKELIRCANALLEFMLSNRVSFRSAKKNMPLSGTIGDIISGYLTSQKALRRAPDTLDNYRRYLAPFKEYLDEQGIRNLSSLSSSIILHYVKELCFLTKPTVHNALCALRVFFRYLHDTSILEIDWSYIIPKDNYKKEARLPSTYSKDEVASILNAVDRGSPRGKRDYAMILVAARLGLRASDICGLKFDNLLWEQNLIVLIQAKTQKRVELPLLSDVGNAIIEYLKYGRPQSSETFIFLQACRPFTRLQEPTLHSIVHENMRRAGISDVAAVRKHGPHALRHSLAEVLLQKNTPLPIISEVLGHTNTESTMSYLRIDIQALRQCALDVPALSSSVYLGMRQNG